MLLLIFEHDGVEKDLDTWELVWLQPDQRRILGAAKKGVMLYLLVSKVQVIEFRPVKNDVAFGVRRNCPIMDLSGEEQEYGAGADVVGLKIDLMDAATPDYEHAQVKGMSMGSGDQVAVLGLVLGDSICIEIALRSPVVKITDIMNRQSF